MRRLRFIVTAVLSMTIIGCDSNSPTRSGDATRTPASHPNLVLITLDTTRADRIGAYGDRRAADTPAIDRIAREGALFEDATSPAPLTLPAHCTLFTGRLPPRHGVHENVGILDAATPTLATVLRARRYRTAAFVGSRILERSRGLNRGFEVYDDDIPWRASGQRPRRRADAVVEGALKWIDALDGSSPFFAWMHLYDAHAPYEAAPPFDHHYRDRPYEAAIASIDAQVARLRAFLDQKALTDRTLIVIVGDHGEGLGDHGELTHGLFVYQSVLRVPFILRAPAVALRGRRVKMAVSSADLMPTVLDLLGAGPVKEVDGRTLMPILFRPAGETADVYAENLYVRRRFGWSEMRAIRSGAFKLIDKTRPELYDLAHDPGETHDLAGKLPAVAARLARRLQKWNAKLDSAATPSAAPSAHVAEDVRARLTALGYVAGSTPSRADLDGQAASDPREHVTLFNCLAALANRTAGDSSRHNERVRSSSSPTSTWTRRRTEPPRCEWATWSLLAHHANGRKD